MRSLAWIPNLLTGLRLLLLPVLILLLARSPQDRVAAGLILLIMGVTDALDGWAARRLGAVSRLGSLADAVADRLVLFVPLLFVAIAAPAGLSHVPLWMPLWLVALDVLVGSVWLVARRQQGIEMPAAHNMPGRVATWVLFGLLFWIVLGLPDAGVLFLGVVGLGLVTTSALIYLRRWSRGSSRLDGRSAAD